ncbi:MAG: hypothetical protein ACYS8L_08225, partial [Planctomycetota bacterium]
MPELLSLPADGYLLRHGALIGRLGPSLANVPLLKGSRWARGYVLLHKDSLGAWQSLRLRAGHSAAAEATAKDVARRTGRPIVLGELVQASPGGVEVIRELSTHEPMSESELITRALGAARRMGEVELRKADPVDPYLKSELERLGDELASELTELADPKVQAAVARTINTARIDWGKATPAQMNRFEARLVTAMRVASGGVWKSVRGPLTSAALSMADDARRAFKRRHELEITSPVALKDKAAVKRSVGTQVHYIREYSTGEIAPALSARARTVVESGVKRGAGTVEIGKE